MKSVYVLAIVILVLVLNCKESLQNKETDSTSEIEKISAVDISELKLDQGNKWIANVETHEGVNRMDSIISVFENESNTDYVALGDDLSKQTGYIIKNCSMKGEPHDQLHVVLVPMLDEISIVRAQTNTSESKAAIKRLEQLISAYFKHFKV